MRVWCAGDRLSLQVDLVADALVGLADSILAFRVELSKAVA